MTADVLLARPHPFLIDAMSEALAAAGFNPVRFKRGDKLPPMSQLHGAVISAAVSAENDLEMSEAFRLVRLAFPRLPVAVTALASFDSSVMRVRSQLDLRPHQRVVGPVLAAGHADLGTPDLVLLLLGDDFTLRPQAVRHALKAHFHRAGDAPTAGARTA